MYTEKCKISYMIFRLRWKTCIPTEELTTFASQSTTSDSIVSVDRNITKQADSYRHKDVTFSTMWRVIKIIIESSPKIKETTHI